MEILVLPHYRAIKYIPDSKTYTIRIIDSSSLLSFNLGDSLNYLKEDIYTFDDIEEDYINNHEGKDLKLFNENLATELINNFEKYKGKVDRILIHSKYGKGRATATALALNDIYGFGLNKRIFFESGTKINLHIYYILRKVGNILNSGNKV